jgi:trehalose utilization protein
MTTTIRFLAAILAIAVTSFSPLSAGSTIHVIVFADGYVYGQPAHELARSLNSTSGSPAVEVDFANTENILVPGSLNRYDVLVMFNHNDISSSHEKNITDFVRAGGGLLALHHVINKANNNPELTRLVGGYYDAADGMVSHRNYNIVRIDKASHPILDGVPEKFSVRDEQDFRIRFYPEQPVEKLLSCDIENNGPQEDCGWTRTEGAGRIVYLSPGDNIAANPFVNNSALYKLILNSILWVSGN